MPIQLRSLLLSAWLVASVAACVSSGPGAAQATGAFGVAPAAPALKLERVVMLMRHGVRPPTRAGFAPDGIADQPWPEWKVDFGELTRHGYDAVRLLGAWDRKNWAARGLLPVDGCLAAADIEVAASSKSRTQATARALAEGMAPGCRVEVRFPAGLADDVEFHPFDARAMPIDADEALRAVRRLAPPGGLQAELEAQSGRFALIERALGCTAARQGSGCRLSAVAPGIVRHEDDRPDIGDPFGLASTISQTFLLQYLEGMPMSDVAWGRLTRPQIEDLLVLNSLKFHYEGRAPYVAARAASPLASRMLEAMRQGPRLTVLVGHDTNITDLAGLLELHWKVPTYPRNNAPPGGALGFETLSDASGQVFVRAFYRAQTMDQVRELQALHAGNAPSYEYLPIPGCATPCPLADFERAVRPRLVAPLRSRADN